MNQKNFKVNLIFSKETEIKGSIAIIVLIIGIAVVLAVGYSFGIHDD